MKNFFYRTLRKGVVALVKFVPPAVYGVSQFGLGLLSDSYYSIRGNKKKQKLIEKLLKQNIKFNIKQMRFKSDYQYADACVISGLTASQMLLSKVPLDVKEAYEKAYPNLASKNSFVDQWSSYEDYESRLGFINGVKGKLFEIKYVDYLNENLENGYSASMSDNPINKGWDIKIIGPDNEVENLLQLKATTTVNHVQDAIEKYPHIDIITLEDLQGQLSSIHGIANVSASNISNDELMLQIADATDGAQAFFLTTIPLLGVGYLIISSYKKSDLTEFKKHQEFAKRASDLAFNTTLISISATPFIGIPLVLGKAYLFRKAKRDKEIIKYLKDQFKRNKTSQKNWAKRVSRRTFLKGLSLAASNLKP